MWLLLAMACTSEPADTDVATDELRFALPLDDPTLFDETQRVGVDHDPEVYEELIDQVRCTDYTGRAFPWCYDEHGGTDFLLEGAFDTMDAGSTLVVAAADGVVLDLEQDQYDRCHATTEGVSCDGHDMVANFVLLEHEDGVLSSYLHLLKGSVLVQVGQEVECGEPLALVGSSGLSSTPHLHFALESADGRTLDPYAGPYSQPESWWLDQGRDEGLPGAACPE